MKLTPSQKALLQHRLSADVIAGCLADTEELKISLAEAEEAERKISAWVEAGQLPLEQMNKVEIEVVRDCLDGSTFFADEDDNIALGYTTRGKQRTFHKAADQLEAEILRVTGAPVRTIRS